MGKKWSVAITLASLSALIVAPNSAYAQTATPIAVAKAQEFYEIAIAAMDAKDYEQACKKLEQVTQLVPSGRGGHEMLAECYEKIGRLGSAWEQYTLAQSLAQAAGDQKLADEMAAKAAAIEPKAAKLNIVVPNELRSLAGLTISRDGIVQEKPLWNTALPVDTGKHLVEARAAGRQSWKREIEISADGTVTSVDVPPMAPQIIDVIPTMQSQSTPEPVTRQVVIASSWQRPVGWTAVGIGASSFIASGILATLAVGRQAASNAEGHCRDNQCDAAGLVLRAQGLGLANGATATAIMGGVFAAAGLVLVIAAPSSKQEKNLAGQTAGMQWEVGVSPTSVGFRGAW